MEAEIRAADPGQRQRLAVTFAGTDTPAPGGPPMRRTLGTTTVTQAPTQGYQRLTYLVGAVLLATGLVHAVIWAVVGGSVEGPLSWRKPTTFGISFGLTTITLGWLAGYLPVRRATGWIGACLLCASTSLEVAWVALQHARGVPSHFNTATTLDNTLFIMGGAAIAVTALVIAAMTVAAFTRTTAAPPMAWAIRAGLVSLLTAQAVGAWMIVHGLALVDSGADPLTQSMSTYGAAGAMKLAHGVPMHAIQVLLVLAWLLSRSRLSQRRQVGMVALAIAGYAGLFAVTLLRTIEGAGPLDLPSAATAAYLIAAALLAVPVVIALASARRGAAR
jgi:hypothetical protein